MCDFPPRSHRKAAVVERRTRPLDSVWRSVHSTLWPPSATTGLGKEDGGDWQCWVGGGAPHTPGRGTRGPMLMGDQRESSGGEGTDGGVRWSPRAWVSVSPVVPKGCSRLQDQGREASDKSSRSRSPQTCQWFWVVLLNFPTSDKEEQVQSHNQGWLGVRLALIRTFIFVLPLTHCDLLASSPSSLNLHLVTCKRHQTHTHFSEQ